MSTALVWWNGAMNLLMVIALCFNLVDPSAWMKRWVKIAWVTVLTGWMVTIAAQAVCLWGWPW